MQKLFNNYTLFKNPGGYIMERPVYCHGWLRGRPNCHPVHPMKHMGIIEDLERNHATMLSWSIMGGGAISLPFLEEQIYGEVPPQLRFHGYMNEKEFNEECLKRGILPFAVIYEAQGWEFPVVLNEEETEILEMNILRSGEDVKWYGLREFTNNQYHKLFKKKFEDYFPGGLYNSDGENVTDLWTECATKDMYGNPTHCRWVEVEGLTRTCHGMCRNNPVWREYLKKNIEIIIDAGARAIQLDETETPICLFGAGGCFCKDCLKQFRVYLRNLKVRGQLPKEMEQFDLETFDYAKFLRERNITWPRNFSSIPFADLYWRFHVETHNKHFQELVTYAREYAGKKGIDIKVSGNFTNMHLLYLPSLDYVDCCTTELRRTVFKRHNWLRMAAGYTQDKPVVLAESPYDGFMPKFVELIHKGKADDYYRLFMMEPAVHGISMAFPYGAWMGNKTKDSFHAPYKTGEEVQDFLYYHDDLFSKKSGANVLVLYSFNSYMQNDWHSGQGENLFYTDADDLLSYSVTYDNRAPEMPFFDITQKMIEKQIPYDVKVLGDGDLVPDTFSIDDLSQYDMVVVPGCDWLTENQAGVINEFAKSKPVYVYGDFAQNLADAVDSLKEQPYSVVVNETGEAPLKEFIEALSAGYDNFRIIAYDNANIYIQKAITGRGMVLHLLNYAFDKEKYKTIRQSLTIDIKLEQFKHISTYTLSGEQIKYDILQSPRQGFVRLKLYDVPCYGAILFHS